MSGNSYGSTCPVCGSEMQAYNDWKPFDYTINDCSVCGFYSEVHTGLRSKEELLRNEQEPLTPEEIKERGWYSKALSENTEEYKKRNKEVQDWNF